MQYVIDIFLLSYFESLRYCGTVYLCWYIKSNSYYIH